MFGIKLLTSKKGFAYLLIVSIFVAVLLIIFLTYNSYSYADRQELHGARITTMNNFVKDFNEDIHRATFISSFRALVALEDAVAISGEFFDDTETVFKEVFYNGTLDGDSIVIMDGSSFKEYITRVNNLADNVGIIADIVVNSINLSQSNPWIITVTVSATVNVTDFRNTASWSYQNDYITNLPIINLRDPIYSYYTNNKVPNTIRIAPFTSLVIGNDTTNLSSLLSNSYYIASNHSPSFLQRFEGNLSASLYGIESMVDIDSLSVQDIFVYSNRTKVDYMYFTDESASVVCNVYNVSPSHYFVVPADRLELYEIDGLTYSTSC